MSTAISVKGLGKRYTINEGAARPTTLRDTIAQFARLGHARHAAVPTPAAEQSTAPKEFWALKDINFDIAEGERIGIIGANGAGKSTLLKILSRVTIPTEGSVSLTGRVASLLEVGTGFHPELSGRENVFLNGAILGMPRAEIRRKFDQIVAFSGVEKFIDTPVKHYSSGMYVRLAFSVSAWLDPDILIVDEVLAVGDQAFQKKCADRMKELTKEGRTVLFVSHSMASVKQMCQKALYLQAGRVVAFKPVEDATVDYEQAADQAAGIIAVAPHLRSLQNPADRGGTGAARICAVRLPKRATEEALPQIPQGGTLVCEIDFATVDPKLVGTPIDLGFGIDTEAGVRVFTDVSAWHGVHSSAATGVTTIELRIDSLLLRPGAYLLSFVLIDNGVTVDSVIHGGAFAITGTTEITGVAWRSEHGAVRFPTTFSSRITPS